MRQPGQLSVSERHVDAGDFCKGALGARRGDDLPMSATFDQQLGHVMELTTPTSKNARKITDRHNNMVTELLRANNDNRIYPKAHIVSLDNSYVVNIDWRGLVDDKGRPFWEECANCYYIHHTKRDVKARLAEFRYKHFPNQGHSFADAETPDADSETTLASILAKSLNEAINQPDDPVVELDITMSVENGNVKQVQINEIRGADAPSITVTGGATSATISVDNEKLASLKRLYSFEGREHRSKDEARRKQLRDNVLELVRYLGDVDAAGGLITNVNIKKTKKQLMKLRHGLFARPYQCVTGH